MREFWLILAKGGIWSTKECSKKRGQVNWQELWPSFQKAAESALMFSFCGCIMWVEEDIHNEKMLCHSYHLGKSLHKVIAEEIIQAIFSSIQALT